jgi:secretion/DNA translocation related CpaE-like protein
MTAGDLVPAPDPVGHPLLITDDEVLVGDVLRLAAAAGVPVEVHRRPDPSFRSWGSAPLVLVGADQAQAVAGLRPPWRGDVHLVSLGPADDLQFRVAVDVGARSVMELPEADRWLVELLADVSEGGAAAAVTVGVVGGSGGVGASVLAAAISVTAARGETAMLVDLDPLGPGVARLVGIDDPAGTTWADLQDSHGRLGGRALRESLARAGGLSVLGWGTRSAGAVPSAVSPALAREVVAAGQRGHDWVVLDLPRSTEGPVAGLVGRCDHVVLVVRAALGGVAAGARMADRLRVEAVDAGVVVRSRRGSPPEEDVARAVGLPLLGVLPDERRLEEHLDLGLGPVRHQRSALAVTAARLVDRWRSVR